jgi:hypothetical protein
MGDFAAFSDYLVSAIPDFAKFLVMSDCEELMVLDFKGDSIIVEEIDGHGMIKKISCGGVSEEIVANRDDCFVIVNPKKQTAIIPIDGKNGLLGYGTSNCDFVFFDDCDFCFVELKLNASSTVERAVRGNRKDAVRQLSGTIDYFDEKLSKSYLGHQLEAYVCTPSIYPRNDSSWNSIRVEFLEKYGMEL